MGGCAVPGGPAGRGERGHQHRDHVVQIGTAQLPGTDPPQVELMRGAGVLPVDGVAPVGDARADQQHVGRGRPGQFAERRRDDGGGMAAQHLPGGHVPGVAGLPGDRAGRVAEPVVIVGHRDYPRATAPADRAAPGAGQRLGRPADDELDGVRAGRGVGEVADAEVAPQLLRREIDGRTGHGDSSLR